MAEGASLFIANPSMKLHVITMIVQEGGNITQRLLKREMDYTFHHRIPLCRRPLPLVDLDAAGAEEVERGGEG